MPAVQRIRCASTGLTVASRGRERTVRFEDLAITDQLTPARAEAALSTSLQADAAGWEVAVHVFRLSPFVASVWTGDAGLRPPDLWWQE